MNDSFPENCKEINVRFKRETMNYFTLLFTKVLESKLLLSAMAMERSASEADRTGLVKSERGGSRPSGSSCSVALMVLCREQWPMLSSLGRGMR